MDFEILGPLQVHADEGPVRIRSARQRAILAVLILHAGQVVSTDRLLDLVWNDAPPQSGARSLQFHVWKLRNALEPQREGGEGVIATRPPGYVLLAAPDDIDAVRFERLTSQAHELLASDPARARQLIRDAMAMWRGPPLDDFTYEEFARPEITRLEQLRERADEDRIEAALALGEHHAVLAELAALTEQHPLQERLWGQYMVALARSGRQADALAAYRELAGHLREELGIEPSPEIREIEDRILLQDRALLAPHPGRVDRLRGYELLDRLGEGAFGEVWHAVQPGIGREVAIKVIRPDLANRPEFVRAFEAEARVLASLEHPNIVPLFDFWRDPEGAYLVMPLLRGGSVAGAVRDGPVAPGACLAVVAAVADALAYAHRHQVVHGDLTPENVLLDDENRPYVADFGIASLLGDCVTAEGASPAFRSPEQLAGETPTPRSDVFGLGGLTHLLLTGTPRSPGAPLPQSTTLPADLAATVNAVLATACAPEPAMRYEGPEAFVEALAAALGSGPRSLPSAGARNPYKGLRAFGEADAADFFGREALVTELIAAVAHHRLVGVVGPSGCGKSSLVRAGLLPNLRKGAVPGAEGWLIADLSPGQHPMAELEAALLGVATRRAPELPELLADPRADPGALAEALLPEGGDVLLLVDQLEELFTLTQNEVERRRFIDLLTKLVANPRSRIRVVVTLRADFYDRPLEHAAFGEILGRGLVSVATPSESALARAVTGPAAAVGVTFEPGLETEIVRDVRNQPGALPLMEYALTELFVRRDGPEITTAAYQAMGGVASALGRRAEELYSSYEKEQRLAVRQIFLRLVQVAEDTTDTRRRVPRHEPTGLGIDAALVDDVLASYGAHRLLTFDRDPTTRSPTVEVAHEALLTRWDRLRSWVEERRDDLVLHRRLRAAVSEWIESGRLPGYLLAGGRLEHYEQFAANTDLALTDSEHEYLRESRRHADDVAGGRRRRRRAVLSGFAAAAVVASLLAGFALIQRAESSRNAAVARSRELAASAISVADTDPELSLLLALASAEGGEPIFESVTALHQAVLGQRVLRRLDGPDGAQVILTPDGSGVLLNAHDSGTAQRYDVETGRLVWDVDLPSGPGEDIEVFAFDRSGTELLYSYMNQVHLLDPATGASRTFEIQVPCEEWEIVPDGAGRIDLARPTIVYATADGGECSTSSLSAGRLDVSTGAIEARVDLGADEASIDTVGGWSTSTNGDLLALKGPDGPIVLDLTTAESQTYGPPAEDSAHWVLSPDGTLLVTIGNDRNDVWDLVDDAQLWSFPGRMGYVRFTADGRLLVGSPYDGPARIWDARSGEELVVLHGVEWAQISDDGLRALYMEEQAILNTGANGEVGGFDLPRHSRYCLGDLDVTSGRFAVRWGCGTNGGVAGVFDRTSGELLFSVNAAGDDIALSPDGRFLAVQDWPGEDTLGGVRVHDIEGGGSVLMEGLCTWNARTRTGGPGCRTHPDVPFPTWINSLTFSPDGSTLIAGSWEPDTRVYPMIVWDVGSGEIVYLSPEGIGGRNPVMSPGGDRVLVWTEHDEHVVVLDTADWTQVDGPPIDWVNEAMVFTPDGRHLVLSSDPDVGLRVVDTNTWETIRHVGRLDADPLLAVDPSGTLVAAGHDSGIVQVFAFETLHLLQRIPVGEPLRNLVWLSDNHLMITPISGPGIVVTTDVDELLEVAKSRVTRDFTASECAAYHIDPCPVA